MKESNLENKKQVSDVDIIKYLDYMIKKHKELEDKYPASNNQAKRKAYQDIRYKMTSKNEKIEFKISKKICVSTDLSEFDINSGDTDMMEVTENLNGMGFDIYIWDGLETRFTLTWGQFKALKYLVKELEANLKKTKH